LRKLERNSDAGAGLLIVANSNDETHRDGEGYLTFLDPETGRAVATVPDGGVTAHEVIASPDGRFAYLPIYGNGDVGNAGSHGSVVTVIDIAARELAGSIDFGHGVRPHFGVFGPDGLLYVTGEMDHAVFIIDPQTRKVIATIPTGQPESHNVAISRNGRRGYTSNVYTGTVSVLDVPARKLLEIISVAPPDAANPARRKRVQRVSISNDGSMVFTCDWTRSELVVIDAAAGAVKARVPLPTPGYGTVSTPDGRWLLVAADASCKVTVVDLQTLTIARNIDVPAKPQEIIIRPGGEIAYVSCDRDQKIAAIRLADWTVEKLFDTGYYPDGLTWAAAV
jgi:YVTN family beta-propeller protein